MYVFDIGWPLSALVLSFHSCLSPVPVLHWGVGVVLLSAVILVHVMYAIAASLSDCFFCVVLQLVFVLAGVHAIFPHSSHTMPSFLLLVFRALKVCFSISFFVTFSLWGINRLEFLSIGMVCLEMSLLWSILCF